jgi:hypothetical protein
MKIGILIPSTSKGRNWECYKESYLCKITLKTFLLTYDKEHSYEFYIGIDRDDPILDNEEIKKWCDNFKNVFKNINFYFIYMDGIVKGHLTVMWNRLFKKAFDDNCDYFYQCGDDIEFKTKGWINECIQKLQENKNLGLTGPINNNPRILTQTFVSRIHYNLFGYYFPEELINWCCDDWINEVYKNIDLFFPLLNQFCVNIGGEPRYVINNDDNYHLNMRTNTILLREQCGELIKRDVILIKNIIQTLEFN